MNHKTYSIIEIVLMVMIAIMILLRFYHLGQVPVSTYWDETAMMVDLKAVLATGQDMHGLPWYQAIYPSYGDYKLPLYLWLSLLPAKVFGVTALSVRLVSAITGVATIIVAAFLASALTQSIHLSTKHRRLLLLSTMLVVASSPWSFLFSRTAFEGHVSQLCVALSIYCLLTMPKHFWRGVLSGLLGAMAVYGYFASRYVWFPLWFIALALVFSQTSRHTWKKNIVSALLGLGLSVVLLVPLFTSPWYHPMQQFRLSATSILNPPPDPNLIHQWREWSGNTVLSKLIFHRDIFLVRELASHYADHLSLQTLFLQGDTNLRHSTTQHGLFLWPFVIALISGVIFLLKKGRVLVFLLSWWLLALLPASVPFDTPHALRSLNGLVPLSILMGIGSASILVWVYAKNIKYRLIGWGFLGAILVASVSFIFYYFAVYPANSASAWQAGYQEQVNQLLQERRNQEVAWVLVPDERFYLYMMAYAPYRGDEFVTWPENNFKKIMGDAMYFQRDQKDAYLLAMRKDGEGLVLVDDEFDVEKIKDELEAKTITCTQYQISQVPTQSYRVCRVFVK